MHFIHVRIVASAVPPHTSASYPGARPLQRRAQHAFHAVETASASEETRTASRLLPLFASHS